MKKEAENKKTEKLSSSKKNKVKRKISKARETIREEMRSIIEAAKKKKLIQATASTVRKARTFTAEDIQNFISDVKVKTTNEIKKVVRRNDTSTSPIKPISKTEPITTETNIEKKDDSMSYYDRWYSLASEKNNVFLTDNDVDKIWHVFDKKATSYKYFWFLSILKIYKETNNGSIPFKDILVKMVSVAWSWVFMENSEFPKADQLPLYLRTIQSKAYLDRLASEKEVGGNVLEFYDEWKWDALLKPLLNNVPYRFLSPWIPFTNNDDVVAKSNDPDTKCPYALHDDYLTINPIWGDYFLENYDKLTQFAEKELRLYLKCQ